MKLAKLRALFKRKPRAKPKAKPRAKRRPEVTVASVVSGLPTDAVVHQLNPARAVEPVERTKDGTLAMQGHAPIVKISRGRRRCEGCGKRVYKRGDMVAGKFMHGKRHICPWNAHNYLDTLTAEERLQLIEDLKALGIKEDC